MIDIDKFVAIKNQLKQENGEFTFFGLFLRDDAPDKWDVLVAAPWAEADSQAALKTVSAAITSSLSASELLRLSRVVILDHDNPMLRAIWAAMKFKDGVGHFVDCNINGLQVRHAYILESQPATAQAGAT